MWHSETPRGEHMFKADNTDPVITTAQTRLLFTTTQLAHETPRTICAQGQVSVRTYLCLTSLDHQLFVCLWTCTTGIRNIPLRIYSVCQAGITVINASFDRCWKVSLKHDRTSTVNTADNVLLTAHVSTLYGSIFNNGTWFQPIRHQT